MWWMKSGLVADAKTREERRSEGSEGLFIREANVGLWSR